MKNVILQGGPDHVHRKWDIGGHAERWGSNDLQFRYDRSGAIYNEVGGRRGRPVPNRVSARTWWGAAFVRAREGHGNHDTRWAEDPLRKRWIGEYRAELVALLRHAWHEFSRFRWTRSPRLFISPPAWLEAQTALYSLMTRRWMFWQASSAAFCLVWISQTRSRTTNYDQRQKIGMQNSFSIIPLSDSRMI